MDENRNITHEELSELLSERKDPARQIAILEAGLANANAEVARLRQACQRAILLVDQFGLDAANGNTYCGVDEGVEMGRRLEESLLAELRAAVGDGVVK